MCPFSARPPFLSSLLSHYPIFFLPIPIRLPAFLSSIAPSFSLSLYFMPVSLEFYIPQLPRTGLCPFYAVPFITSQV